MYEGSHQHNNMFAPSHVICHINRGAGAVHHAPDYYAPPAHFWIMEHPAVNSLDHNEMEEPLADEKGAEKEEKEAAIHHDNEAANNSSVYSNKIRTSEGAQLSERRSTRPSTHHHSPVFGLPVQVDVQGNFPSAGSVLGHYFLLGKLGEGTFSSIHKCINLDYFSRPTQSTTSIPSHRLAAAKIDIGNFVGVLDAEAMMLDFLYQSMPPGTVPAYLGHYKSGNTAAALIMEYLPGSDMHVVRESVTAGSDSRRIHVVDAVYLTADVMLPLLQAMHRVGIVHRDVKPSNCVRAGTTADNKRFALVDFGLSKTVVVPADSADADQTHPWPAGHDWLKPRQYTGAACWRKERPKADFRGTSMYASPRIHQMRDYGPRDDMWSLLYVFCDLVSGGLPWMSLAAERRRDDCQTMKEKVHGEGQAADETELLLMGNEYHIAKYRQIPLPEPLAMSKDVHKVNLLRKAFQHLAGLQFHEFPDYELIQSCIKGFLDDPSTHPEVKRIDWEHSKESVKASKGKREVPLLGTLESIDPIGTDLLEKEEDKETPSSSSPTRLDSLSRLPLRLQFQVRQLDYYAANPTQTPIFLALRDWLALVLPLLYEEWDAQNLEEGGHRTSNDGYRRDTFLLLLRKCQECAEKFHFFQSPDAVFESNGVDENSLGKRRKIAVDEKSSVLTATARALFFLEHTIEEEAAKRSPPPKMLNFGA